MTRITQILAREVLDSRGYPTVEVDVILEGGDKGRAAAPSGASTGKYEAHELRDADMSRFSGKGVLRAVRNVKELIAPRLIGNDVFDQQAVDRLLLDLDGSSNKSALGANTLLAVSLATAKAAANCCKLPLYRYLGGAMACRLPMPMVNVLNGGVHADNGLAFQEFMLVPVGAKNFSQAVRIAAEVFHALGNVLKANSHTTAVGDEGGYAPKLTSEQEAITTIIAAITQAGYEPEKEVCLALDVAASEFYHDGNYRLGEQTLTSKELVEHLAALSAKYPIVSIEDGLHEDDWEGFAALTAKIGDRVRIVGDDLFVTNKKRMLQGAVKRAANAILIKPNQIGTLSETLDTVISAGHVGFDTVVSHRSGETEDTTIADIAVATNSFAIKTGSMSRSERICKYNQLLRIEEELGETAVCSWS
ncbi:MAG: phosphopyruvate hydratase [Pseudomonadota bacterium]|nr:phosphopyruvate hydratase [Pseudomonadota bacterium]